MYLFNFRFQGFQGLRLHQRAAERRTGSGQVCLLPGVSSSSQMRSAMAHRPYIKAYHLDGASAGPVIHFSSQDLGLTRLAFDRVCCGRDVLSRATKDIAQVELWLTLKNPQVSFGQYGGATAHL